MKAASQLSRKFENSHAFGRHCGTRTRAANDGGCGGGGGSCSGGGWADVAAAAAAPAACGGDGAGAGGGIEDIAPAGRLPAADEESLRMRAAVAQPQWSRRSSAVVSGARRQPCAWQKSDSESDWKSVVQAQPVNASRAA